jgi:hypothetical protein
MRRLASIDKVNSGIVSEKNFHKIHCRGKSAIGPVNFTGPIKGIAFERTTSAVGLSRPTLIKIKPVNEAAKRNP